MNTINVTGIELYFIFNFGKVDVYILPVPVAARSAAARLLRLWFRIPLGAWVFVYCDCCVLSSIAVCDELFAGPEELY
jgi:hypothetical protein